ncbi:MAG: inorganic phosphate transporter, partial [Brevibacterium sp.]|uniref:inorganic phosphate transporter n=1 Tax=Brevibacterium sp. TaxID=1701 RepID=UPI003F9081B0
MLAATLVSFTLWSFDFVGAGSNRLVLITTIVFDTFMAFNIGGNDVANSFGTSVGAGTLSMKQALMVAAVFEVSGAVLAGGEVTDTVRSGISSVGNFLIMAMIGAGLWFIGRNVIRTVGTGLTKIHPASGFAAE